MLPLLLTALLLQAQPSSLETSLRNTIAASGAEVAVIYTPMDGRAGVFIDPDKVFHAASTMKVPVMIELFRQVKAGTLKLDDTVIIENEFHSIVDASPYRLSEGDDSDKEVYAAVGKAMTLGRLCELMITVSSNFAANILIDKLGAANVQKTVISVGAPGMQVLRGVEDQKAFDKGLNNTTTARGLHALFHAIGHGRAVDAEQDAAMIEILKRQQFNDGIPAGLPQGIAVAHKTGSITRIHHDAGIVYAARPYVLVVLVRGIEDQKKSAALIADISRLVYAASR